MNRATAGICVRNGEQCGIGDIQVRLVKRDLCEVVGVFLFEPVTLDFTVARGLQTFVFPDQWIDHISAQQIGAVNDDAVTVSAEHAFDRGEGPRLARCKLEAGGDKVLAHPLFEIVPAIEDLARPGRAIQSATVIAQVGTNISVDGRGDFNGDGTSDIALHQDVGTTRTDLIDNVVNNTVVNPHTVAVTGIDWHVS